MSMSRSYREINAVHESDLNNLLDKVGLLTDFESSNAKCKFCKEVVSIDTIYSIIKDSDKYKIVCSKAECVSSLMEYLDTKRRGSVDNG